MGHELVSRSARRFAIAGAVAAVAAGTASVSNAAIELGEGLSVTGFADMSISVFDPKGSSSSKSAGIDQFETDFLYSGSGGVSAQVDIEYGESSAGDPSDDTTFVEQAFVTKKFNDQFSIKVGRFLSYSGWETEEPTGLFQYSGAGYAQYFYGYYQQGVSAYYGAEKFAVMGSVVTSAFDPIDRDTEELGYEIGAAVMPIPGLTAKAFYIINESAGPDDDKLINLWASYSMSGFTFAGEFNTADYADGGSGDGFLLMANYATGPFGITARYVDFKQEDRASLVDPDFKNNSITLSPSYKVGDNLLLVAEVRRDNYGGGAKANSFALEALFTF
jgi:hypothetical protein